MTGRARPGTGEKDLLQLMQGARTEGVARLAADREYHVEEQALAEIPAGRYGEPAEFGGVAAFLCSRQASYVTGTALRCDGGLVRNL